MFNHTPVDLPPVKQETVTVFVFMKHQKVTSTHQSQQYFSIRNKKGLHEWRKRVGYDVANYVARTAASRGTKVHHMCEDYLNNIHVSWPRKMEGT